MRPRFEAAHRSILTDAFLPREQRESLLIVWLAAENLAPGPAGSGPGSTPSVLQPLIASCSVSSSIRGAQLTARVRRERRSVRAATEVRCKKPRESTKGNAILTD